MLIFDLVAILLVISAALAFLNTTALSAESESRGIGGFPKPLR